MKIAMMRTAGSPLMHVSGDSSAAIFDADMLQLVAQGNDIPTMLGSAVISTRMSVEAVGRENLRTGDVIVSNDAYVGGGNLNRMCSSRGPSSRTAGSSRSS